MLFYRWQTLKKNGARGLHDEWAAEAQERIRVAAGDSGVRVFGWDHGRPARAGRE